MTGEMADFWEIQMRRPYNGGIGVRNCTFQGCTLLNVGLAAGGDMIQKWLMG
jgi:hypothetical protein